MKRLTVLRHAKASPDQPHIDDFDRPLTDRGWSDARRTGRELKQRGMEFDLCLSSPSVRTRQTVDGVEQGYGRFGFRVDFEPAIYEASVHGLLEVVRSLPDEAKAVLLVGHNPGVERLIVELASGDRDGRRERVAGSFPTCGVAVVALPAEQWSRVEPASGEIVELILPGELD